MSSIFITAIDLPFFSSISTNPISVDSISTKGIDSMPWWVIAGTLITLVLSLIAFFSALYSYIKDNSKEKSTFRMAKKIGLPFLSTSATLLLFISSMIRYFQPTVSPDKLANTFERVNEGYDSLSSQTNELKQAVSSPSTVVSARLSSKNDIYALSDPSTSTPGSINSDISDILNSQLTKLDQQVEQKINDITTAAVGTHSLDTVIKEGGLQGLINTSAQNSIARVSQIIFGVFDPNATIPSTPINTISTLIAAGGIFNYLKNNMSTIVNDTYNLLIGGSDSTTISSLKNNGGILGQFDSNNSGRLSDLTTKYIVNNGNSNSPLVSLISLNGFVGGTSAFVQNSLDNLNSYIFGTKNPTTDPFKGKGAYKSILNHITNFNIFAYGSDTVPSNLPTTSLVDIANSAQQTANNFINSTQTNTNLNNAINSYNSYGSSQLSKRTSPSLISNVISNLPLLIKEINYFHYYVKSAEDHIEKLSNRNFNMGSLSSTEGQGDQIGPLYISTKTKSGTTPSFNLYSSINSSNITGPLTSVNAINNINANSGYRTPLFTADLTNPGSLALPSITKNIKTLTNLSLNGSSTDSPNNLKSLVASMNSNGTTFNVATTLTNVKSAPYILFSTSSSTGSTLSHLISPDMYLFGFNLTNTSVNSIGVASLLNNISYLKYDANTYPVDKDTYFFTTYNFGNKYNSTSPNYGLISSTMPFTSFGYSSAAALDGFLNQLSTTNGSGNTATVTRTNNNIFCLNKILSNDENYIATPSAWSSIGNYCQSKTLVFNAPSANLDVYVKLYFDKDKTRLFYNKDTTLSYLNSSNFFNSNVPFSQMTPPSAVMGSRGNFFSRESVYSSSTSSIPVNTIEESTIRNCIIVLKDLTTGETLTLSTPTLSQNAVATFPVNSWQVA